LSVVLPAYEEAANLNQMLPALQKVLGGMGVGYEIVVVDAQEARDATAEVCARHGVACHRRTGGQLYGDAVRTALAVARGDKMIFMDADGSHSPEFLPQLWAQRDAADMVIASRYVAGGKTENPAILILMSLVVNVVFRLVLRLPCADVSNSFRLYHGPELRALTLTCNNFDIVEEILVKLYFARPGYKIREVPFTFEKRKAGKTKRSLLAFVLGYIATLLRLHGLKRKLKLATTAGTP
jgi:dolichol-phosphate mannosyltransferase